jgi:hypothetical protein
MWEVSAEDTARYFCMYVGMMGIKSKKLMIKYYHVMVLAVENPDTFIRWKY